MPLQRATLAERLKQVREGRFARHLEGKAPVCIGTCGSSAVTVARQEELTRRGGMLPLRVPPRHPAVGTLRTNPAAERTFATATVPRLDAHPSYGAPYAVQGCTPCAARRDASSLPAYSGARINPLAMPRRGRRDILRNKAISADSMAFNLPSQFLRL
uniref:Uncharacterized protein n=1 Tax=viral metagenome TaxID=1070528 RepID=A0A6C0ASV5_9ZZZZ